MRTVWKRFLEDESGLETLEYALISSIVVASVLAAISEVSLWLITRFEGLLAVLNG